MKPKDATTSVPVTDPLENEDKETSLKQPKEQTDPVLTEVKDASLKSSKEQIDKATKALETALEENQKATTSLGEVNKKIDRLNRDVAKFEEAKETLHKMKQIGSKVKLLTSDISGVNIAKSIMDSSKSIKTALDSIESLYPDAKAMEAKVMSVDVKESEKNDTSLQDYVSETLTATNSIEAWKNQVANLAIANTSFLKVDIDDYIKKVADLDAAIDVVGTDIDSIHEIKKKKLADSIAQSKKLLATIESSDLERTKNENLIGIGNKFIDPSSKSASTPLSSDNKKKSKK